MLNILLLFLFSFLLLFLSSVLLLRVIKSLQCVSFAFAGDEISVSVQADYLSSVAKKKVLYLFVISIVAACQKPLH